MCFARFEATDRRQGTTKDGAHHDATRKKGAVLYTKRLQIGGSRSIDRLQAECSAGEPGEERGVTNLHLVAVEAFACQLGQHDGSLYVAAFSSSFRLL